MGPRPRGFVWPAVTSTECTSGRLLRWSTLLRPKGSSVSAPSRRAFQRGTVITDVVILLPVLLTMIAGMFMLGTRISDYMYLNQSTRELGMILSKIPYMYELAFADATARTFIIKPDEVEANGAIKTEAETCIQALSNPEYRGCAGGDCLCALKIARWYATEFMRLKLMMVEWPVTVEVGYGPRDTTSGLCFVDVVTTASNKQWAMVGNGNVKAEAHVPYVSQPVPWNSGTCVGPPQT